MKILTCPVNGPRPIQEFSFGGEVRPMPDPGKASDQAWSDYVFNRSGEPGIPKVPGRVTQGSGHWNWVRPGRLTGRP